jgi:hypothetical protein
VDDAIIHEHQEVAKHYWLSEDGVHHYLKGYGGVGKSKYDHWFKQSFRCEECCLLFVFWFYADIIVSPSYIKLCE